MKKTIRTQKQVSEDIEKCITSFRKQIKKIETKNELDLMIIDLNRKFNIKKSLILKIAGFNENSFNKKNKIKNKSNLNLQY